MPQGFKPRAMRLHRAQAAGKVLDGLPGYSGVCVGFAHRYRSPKGLQGVS